VKAQQAAESYELPVVATGDDEMAVGGRKDLVRHDIGMRIAHAPRYVAACEVVHRLIGQHSDADVEERQIDLLAEAGAFALCKCGLNADDTVEPGEDINPSDTDFLRLAVGLAGQVHDPAHALYQKIVARLLRARTSLAEARDGYIDNARIDRGDAFMVEPEFLQSADFEVFDHASAWQIKALTRARSSGSAKSQVIEVLPLFAA